MSWAFLSLNRVYLLDTVVIPLSARNMLWFGCVGAVRLSS